MRGAAGEAAARHPAAATVADLVSELEDRNGFALRAEVTVVPSSAAAFRRGRILADAAPLRNGHLVWSDSHDQCQIRVDAAGGASRTTLAHEVMHCFQFEMAPLRVVARTPAWIIEGSAEWAAVTVGGRDDPAVDFYGQWQQTSRSLFALDYAAAAYFWTVETLGVDPWLDIPWMIASERRGVQAFSPLLDHEQLALRLATGSLRSGFFHIDVGPIWDLTPPAVPPVNTVRGPHVLTGGSPLSGHGSGPAYSHTPVHWFTIVGEGVDVTVEASVGALQPEGGELHTFAGDSHFEVCFDDSGSHEVYIALARQEPGPISFRLEVLPPDSRCVGGPVGRWVLDELVTGAGDWPIGPVLEIAAGTEPALYNGREVAVGVFGGNDCPFWGDLTLVEEVTVDDARLFPPSDVDVIAAWSGTMSFWCIGNPDQPSELVVGALDDGRLLLTFPVEPGPAPRVSVVLASV